MSEGFYASDGEFLIPTDFTRGPWDPSAQHAGPPSALLGRAAEAIEPGEDWLVSRVSVDILKPVPLAPLRVSAKVERGGRRTQLIRAQLWTGETQLAEASIWRIRKSSIDEFPEVLPHPQPLDVPITPMVHPGWDPSYFTALEWRYVNGSLFEPGPAAVWIKMRQPLVVGETPSALTRVLVVADSGNGVSSVLPLTDYLFINVELSVHLTRQMLGDWVCLDAKTTTGPDGVGVARSTLWDTAGCFGYGAQSLLVAPR